MGGGRARAVNVVFVVERDAAAAVAKAAAAPGGARVLGRLRGGDGSFCGEELGDCRGSSEDMAHAPEDSRCWVCLAFTGVGVVSRRLFPCFDQPISTCKNDRKSRKSSREFKYPNDAYPGA